MDPVSAVKAGPARAGSEEAGGLHLCADCATESRAEKRKTHVAGSSWRECGAARQQRSVRSGARVSQTSLRMAETMATAVLPGVAIKRHRSPVRAAPLQRPSTPSPSTPSPGKPAHGSGRFCHRAPRRPAANNVCSKTSAFVRVPDRYVVPCRQRNGCPHPVLAGPGGDSAKTR